MTNTAFKATCAVCFNAHTLKTIKSGSDKLARHGFNIVGASGYGHLGAWHTGPCDGSDFPHFGVSTEGTEWALAKVRAQLTNAETSRKVLDTKPELTINVGSTRHPVNHTVTSSYTATKATCSYGRIEIDNKIYWVEAYVTIHKRFVAKADHKIKALSDSVAFYETAIAAWKPAEPVAVPVEKRGPVVHSEFKHRKTGRRLIECGTRSQTVTTTEDDSKVTCMRCKKSIDQRADKAAEKAAEVIYYVTLPDSRVKTTTAKNEMIGKRTLVAAVIGRRTDQSDWYVIKWCVSAGVAKRAEREYAHYDAFTKTVQASS